MSKHGKRCPEDCCHQAECCPRGVVEHWRYYRYLKEYTDTTFLGYYWHEFKSLIGLNRHKGDE